ncbi:MAG: glucose dehydrogenase [Deltaproteobacteria bacterium]|nr:glucose dehydrogenase [Deltaproteobacteria bacterium]
MRLLKLLMAAVLTFSISGCYKIRGSSGGGQTEFKPPRKINSSDIALPSGYRIEPVATKLTFPTGVAFDEKGTPYVVEAGYSYGELWTTPRLLKIEPDGKTTVIAEGGKNGPWTGVVYHNGEFFIAEGGELEGGKILKVSQDGKITPLIENLPSMGDHHTNGPAIGPDGMVYFSQGVATNSGVVGEDNFRFGWLKRNPEFHDIPCQDITLSGRNFETKNFIDPDSKDKVSTGAFSPFGRKTSSGQTIKGKVPCSGAVMRITTEGGGPELVAWGFRNPFGMAFTPNGQLFVTDNMYDERGSRPVFGTGDILWAVTSGTWYGWPDYHGKFPLNEHDHYAPAKGKKPELLLARHPNYPPRPVAIFPVHSSSNGLDFSRNPAFGHAGEAFVAQLGDEAPTTGKVLAPVGFKVVRVNVRTGIINEFAVNKGKQNGPASWLGTGGLERPIAARFSPDGNALYVVDFGVLLQSKKGAEPKTETGVLWKITRK